MTARRRTIDPTRTSGLRLRFERDMKRRFAAVQNDIKASIVERNCFGIRAVPAMNEPAGREAFAFERDTRKIEEFIRWLISQEERGILSRVTFAGSRVDDLHSWMDTYLDTAYRQGIRRARQEMRRAGLGAELYGLDPLGEVAIRAAFMQPMHTETIAMAYLRTFEDLKTVLAVMNADLRRALAEALRTGIARGLAEGQSPFKIASDIAAGINRRVEVIGINRARMIARTEVIRAHHLANVNEYRQLSDDIEMTVVAEWSTARDGGVCPTCVGHEGKTYKLNEIESMIPAHPNCRCVAIPVIGEARGIAARRAA